MEPNWIENGKTNMFVFPPGRRAYKMTNPPLVRAMAQVTFPVAAHLATPQGLADLQDALSDIFPVLDQPQAAFQITLAVGQQVTPPLPTLRNVFHNGDGYDLALTAQSVSLSIDERYVDRSHFANILMPALERVGRIGRIRQAVRVGVRYINASPSSPKEWVGLFKPAFTGWTATDIVSSNTSQLTLLISQLSHTNGLVTSATIRTGFLPAGVGTDVTTSPAGSQPSFIADIDMASDRAAEYDATALTGTFVGINHEIAALFEEMLSDEGKRHFGLQSKEEPR